MDLTFDSLPPNDSSKSSTKLKLNGPSDLTDPTPLHREHAIILRFPHRLHIPRELLWEAEMKASILGAAMVAHKSKVPTPKPATSLAVMLSISCFDAACCYKELFQNPNPSLSLSLSLSPLNTGASAPKMACGLAGSSSLFMPPHQRPIHRHSIPTHNSSGTYCLKWDKLVVQRGIKFQRNLVSIKRNKAVQAVAIPAAQAPLDNAEYRKQLAENYGFKQIGEPLPENVTLKNILDTLPKEVFEIEDVQAIKSVMISVTSYALGLFLIAKSPWYLLPLAWAWTGTAATGFFVIGHDCAHKSFSKNKLVEDIVGTLAFMPLIYPYEPWRFKHDRHHAKTNMLKEDTAWLPADREEFESNSLMRKAIIFGYGPIRPWMSIAHWLIWHFNTKKFRPNEVKRVQISLACVFAFMAIGWPLIIYTTGIAGWFKFWLMPWLGYHFWMSTFTMVHHTAPHIPFKSSEEWNAAQAQLNGTVHCVYPAWIEILCHDINVHIPHHISTRIPSYNLRAAHKSLQKNWGKYLNEASWNWRLMKTILTKCHLYDKEDNYISFEEVAPKDSKPITFLRKVMPDYA